MVKTTISSGLSALTDFLESHWINTFIPNKLYDKNSDRLRRILVLSERLII